MSFPDYPGEHIGRSQNSEFLSRYISRLLHDTFCLSTNSLLAPLAAGDMMLGHEAFSLMLFYQDRFSQKTSLFGNAETASLNFENGVSRALNEHCVSFVSDVDGFIVALISLPQGFPLDDEAGLEGFFNTCVDAALPIINAVESSDNIRFRCLYTGPISSIAMLHAHYDLLYGSWQYRKFFLGTLSYPIFTRVRGTPQSAHETAETCCGDVAKKLCALIKEDTFDAALEYAKDALVSVLALEPQTFNGMRINLQCLCTSLRYGLLTANIPVAEGSFGDYSASLIRTTDHNTAKRNFLGCITTIYNSFHEQTGSIDLTKMMRYIDDNISQKWLSVQSVSDKFGVSPSLLSTQFKSRSGKRPIDYIHEKRLEHAISLLGSTDMSMQNICEAAGYGSIATMNRAFRNYAGVTPSWFRNRPQKKE